MILSISDLKKKFLEPKLILHNFYNIISAELKIPKPLLISSKHVNTKNKIAWSVTYSVKWPSEISFTSISSSKSAAAESVAYKCLYWLEINGKINKHKMPVMYDTAENKEILNPIHELKIDPNILDKIHTFVNMNENVSNI